MDSPRTQQIRDWSSLPDDLPVSILSRLLISDLIAVASVCNSWRSVAVSTAAYAPPLLLCSPPTPSEPFTLKTLQTTLQSQPLTHSALHPPPPPQLHRLLPRPPHLCRCPRRTHHQCVDRQRATPSGDTSPRTLLLRCCCLVCPSVLIVFYTLHRRQKNGAEFSNGD